MMVLEVKNVQYSYKSQKEKEILKNVSMQFEEKKFYTIVGASGAGKTTFLSLLAGLDLPVRGTILYNGENIQEKGLNYHRKHHVSLVFQNYNLIDYLTTEENVRLGGTKKPQDLLEKVNIPCEDWKRMFCSYRAASSSGLPLQEHWQATRKCCLLTSRRVTLMKTRRGKL